MSFKSSLSVFSIVTCLLFSALAGAAEQSYFTVEEQENARRLVFNSSLSFNLGSAELSESSEAALVSLKTYLEGVNYEKVRVEGHTDSSTFSRSNKDVLANNWSLSAARASVVVQHLVASGIKPASLYAVGMGETAPRGNNATASGRKLNRRIEVLVELAPKKVADPKAKILSKLKRARPDLVFDGVNKTEVPELYEVEFNQGGVIYSTSTGDFFVAGEIYQVAGNEIVNLTEKKRDGARKDLVANINRDELITFKAIGEMKEEIFVFTDVDCGYCRMLHKEVPKLNAMGIQVSYLAFPRSGAGSPVAQKLGSAWCSDNPQEALTKLKNGEEIEVKVCPSNPVRKQYEMGQKAGVTATPAILFSTGELSHGYMAAEQLAARMGVK